MTLTFTLATPSKNNETVFHNLEKSALQSLRARVQSLDVAVSEGTLGAILLLAGVEARLGISKHVQIHMGAIREILTLCQTRGVFLSDGIKRAIFWQDLNTSVLTTSPRIVSHTTFSELLWIRDPFAPSLFILPPGFQSTSLALDEEFIDVLKDVYAMQCIRETSYFGIDNVIEMARLDNHQASIQSRLVNMGTGNSVRDCCCAAAYLCCTMLRCQLWRTSVVPSHLSSQLLAKLQVACENSSWDDHPELLAWLLYIGGAFSPSGNVRTGYVFLLKANRHRLNTSITSWQVLAKVLKQFIWSDKAFLSQVKRFWEETSGNWT